MKISVRFSPLFYGFAALLAVFTHALPTHAQQAGLGIAVVVNDDVISVLDLETRITMIINASNMKPDPENRARVKSQVLRGLIDEKLMLQESARADIKVKQDDIAERLQTIATNNNMTVNQLANKMMQSGVPITTLTSQIEASISWQIYAGRELSRSITISEDEITDEIKRIQTNAGKPEYLLAEIFIPVDKPALDRNAQTLTQRLLQEMQNGTTFKTLATNFSRASTAALGGDMGWVQFNHLATELQTVVRELKPGQVSLPIRSIGGYYLLLLRDVRNSPGLNAGNTFLKISQLHVSTPNANDRPALDATARQLVALTQNLRSCAQLEAAPAQPGFPFPPSPLTGSMGEISLSNLPQNMQAVVGPLAIGQPSKVLPTGGGLAVMMVCERNSGALDMEAARMKIGNDLTNNRLELSARRRLHDLRRDAFIDIRQ